MSEQNMFVTDRRTLQSVSLQTEAIAMYIRLSEEDMNVKRGIADESNSIVNQRSYIQAYVSSDPDLSGLPVIEYADDGFSGSQFDRPAFQRMIEDAQKGKFSIIITKDYSRLGRDYLEIGNYLEYIFPIMDIRYISINDGYDSAASTGMTGGMNQALKNLVNAMYSRDLSKKMMTASRTKVAKGKYVYSKVAYGYVRDPKDKGHLLVDPEAADVVKQIFQMAYDGKTANAISKYLNQHGFDTIGEYRRKQGYRANDYGYDKHIWSSKIIKSILQNETYLGRIVGNKSEKSIYTNHIPVKHDRSEWIIVENCHEAIITEEMFQCVQTKLKIASEEYQSRINKNRKPNKHHESFKKFFVCGCCGRPLFRECRKMKCRMWHDAPKSECRKQKYDYKTVRERLEQQVVNRMEKYEEQEKSQSEVRTFNEEYSYEEQISKLRTSKLTLYEEYRSGRYSREEFKSLNQTLQEQIEYLQIKSAEIPVSEPEMRSDVDTTDWSVFNLEKYQQIIEKVIVNDESQIEIIWK